MLPDSYLEAQRTIVRGTLADLKTPNTGRKLIGILTDEIGLDPSMLSNIHFSYIYQAIQQEYFDTVIKGQAPQLPNVFTRLEQIYRHNGHEKDATRLVQDWKGKIETLSFADVKGETVQKNARILRANQTRSAVKEYLRGFEKQFHKSLDPESDVADLVAFLHGLEARQHHASDLDSILEEAQKGHRAPQSSGYPRLDGCDRWGPLAVKGYHTGGYFKGRLIVIAGAPGAGKSSIGYNLVARRAEMQLPSIIHSFEMDTESIYNSLICSMAKITPDRAMLPLEYFTDENERKAVEDARTLLRLFVRVYDEPANMAEMARRYRRHQVEFKDLLTLHLIDHAANFVTGNPGTKIWESYMQLGPAFREMSSDHNACTILFAHAKPSLEEEFKKTNRIAGIGDVYGGQALRQSADSFIVVARHSALPCATIFQTFKVRQGTGYSDDYFVVRYDPECDYLTQDILVDDNPHIIQQEPKPLNF